MSEKGKKSASARGRGVQSRQEFTLPAQWESETREGETRAIVDYYSPGKTKYRSVPEVEKEECIYVSKMKAAKAMVIMLQKVITKRNCHPPQRSSKILIMKWNSVCVSANRHRSASLSKTSTRVLDVLRRNVMVCFFVSKSCFQCVFNVFGFSELFL